MAKKNSKAKVAIIVGAGPAGLTAAYELQEKTGIKPIIFEATKHIGGISTTINYKGNRIDIGGHRFFSKSDRVMQWWGKILPLQGLRDKKTKTVDISYQNKTSSVAVDPKGPNPDKTDEVMLVRGRLSRIYYLRSFFDYPVKLNIQTVKNLGIWRINKIMFSYIRARLFPIKNETSLEDFMINRFGRELYRTFFKDYTEKVWGVPCDEISAEWGAQRIKGLSVSKTILNAIKQFLPKSGAGDISQKGTETSLIQQFLYPKYGPGQMWEVVAKRIKKHGGEIHMEHVVEQLKTKDNKISAVVVRDVKTGKKQEIKGDYFFSTMPVKNLVNSLDTNVPPKVKKIANGLLYRDFITVGLLMKKLKIKNETDIKTPNNVVPDNWIYIQERDVKVGRLQIFNNWSPYMVKDQKNIWIGMEYFVNEGDELWEKKDKDMMNFGIEELAKIDIIDKKDVIDGTVIHIPKTYPAYFGTYDQFPTLRKYVDKYENLFLVGRNGMHRYNNQDHSMLTAITAVENIASGYKGKDNIWDVNTETEYHEEKTN